MGGVDFDEVSRELARPLSRRQAVKLFAGATAVSVLGLARAPGAGAQPGRCRKNGTVCRQNYECCSFFCEPASGRCACPPGEQECGPRGRRRCIDCGAGTLDPATCTCTCTQGAIMCGSTCCDPATECCVDYGSYQFCAPLEYCS